MIKIKLRDNLRYFDNFDTDFSIKAGEIKEIPERLFKSYSFKEGLMKGDLILVEGDVEFKYKDSVFKVKGERPFEGIFLFEDNRTVIKNLITNTIVPEEVKPTVIPSGSLSTEKPKEEIKGAMKNAKTK